jgi:hypothetical protein
MNAIALASTLGLTLIQAKLEIAQKRPLFWHRIGPNADEQCCCMQSLEKR